LSPSRNRRRDVNAVTDRYDYDAFGNIINRSGRTPNVYEFG
jgi:hypothetical protein